MEKEGKRIKRWRGGMDAVQTAQYLHDMAAEGWILDEVGYLTYIFREEAPRELTYRVVTLKGAATGEELAAYESKGWKKAGNWEEEYIFVKERDLWNEDAMERQMMVEEIDRRLETDTDMRKNMIIATLAIVGFFLICLIPQYGTELFANGVGMNFLISFGPNLFFILLGGWLVNRRLRKKKERMLDGETVSARDTDWRGSRIRTMAVLAVGVLLIGWAVCIGAEWNQKKYDLPLDVSYRDIPAVRLENLEEGNLEPIGKNISSIKELDGLHLGMPSLEQSEYQRLRWLSNFNNYVVDHRWLLITEQVETNQKVKKLADDTEINLDGEYYDFMLEFLAEKQYQDDLDWEKERPSTKYGLEEHHILTETAKGNFDALHICRTEFGDKTELHILCREGKQVMELNYDGQADADDVLVEIQKVFLAQK